MSNITKIIFSTVLSFIFLVSCGDKERKKSNIIKTVPVYKIKLKDTIATNRFVAAVHAKNNVEMHVHIPGLLDKFIVNEEQKVNCINLN